MSNILGPVISEKSMNEASKGRYTFKVLSQASKTELKKEIEEKFKVNVVSISTMNVKGRTSKAGKRRTEITLSTFKKAIALLKPGQKISIFDIGGKE
jgi:large subunit ribosomal protein L23